MNNGATSQLLHRRRSRVVKGKMSPFVAPIKEEDVMMFEEDSFSLNRNDSSDNNNNDNLCIDNSDVVDMGFLQLKQERLGKIDIKNSNKVNECNFQKFNSPPICSEQTGGEQEIEQRIEKNRTNRQQKIEKRQQKEEHQYEEICALRNPPTKEITADKFSKLNNLSLLFEQGFITESEYKERRSQIIDELTGTHSSSAAMMETASTAGNTATMNTQQRVARRRRRQKRVSSSMVVPRPPPTNFEVIPAERAIKHQFNLATRTWYRQEVFVRIDDTPFGRGGLRLVYHLEEVNSEEYYNTKQYEEFYDDGDYDDDLDDEDILPTTVTTVDAETYQTLTKTGENQENDIKQQIEDSNAQFSKGSKQQQRLGITNKRISYVAKIAIDPNEDPSTYFRDVEMQAHCAHYAKLFNSYNPPRKVEFVKAWILELTERQGSPLCAVERFVSGDYRKHNNNYGYVSDDERNTPQAFSHFTYEASAHTMLVVDIQGVGDMLTDPQIHTLNQGDFGKGNLGVRGFHKFLSTHKCNAICQYLKLNQVNPQYKNIGTIPNLPYMPATKINKSRFREGHYFEADLELRKLVKSKIKNQNRQRELSEDDDSFLRSYLWDSRDGSGLVCSFCSCALL